VNVARIAITDRLREMINPPQRDSVQIGKLEMMGVVPGTK